MASGVITKRRAAVLVPIVVFVAAGLVFVIAPGTQARPSGVWSWPDGPPGQLTFPRQVTTTVARLGGLKLASLREVIATTGSTGQRFTITAGSNGIGQTCFSFGTNAFANRFHCVSDLPAEIAVHNYLSAGGAGPDSVDFVILAGIVRSDVARVVMTHTDGSTQTLSLNRWRAYAYTTSAPDQMPTKLTAYRSDGSVLQEIDNLVVEPPQ